MSISGHVQKIGILILAAVLLVGCIGQNEPTPEVTAEPPSETPTVPSFSFLDSGQRLGAARSWDVSLGDLDGDSDLDAFVANGIRGGVGSAVWLNDGDGTFTIKEQDLGYGMGLELGDLDGDGDLDVFIVSWEEAGQVWLNDGSGLFSNTGQSLGSAGGWEVSLGDLDGDSDLDALIAHEKADTVWLNNGNGTFTDTGQGLGVSYTTAGRLGDLDGDGDLDAFTVGWGDPGRVWFNDGTGTFVDSGQTITSSHIYIHGMALGDVDGDGDLDAFVAGSLNQVWLNDSKGTFTKKQDLFCGAGDSVALGDLDGDGDLDAYLAVGDWSRSDDKVWLNDGSGHFTDSGLVLSTDFSSGIGLGDLDGDGDLDALVVHGELGEDSGGGIPNEVWFNEKQPGMSIMWCVGILWPRCANIICLWNSCVFTENLIYNRNLYIVSA
ncbi:MAG: VCBS repeat-containing protein [Theionarchaea archaeon]|nr:VCBS repeat-containing protein [Theionarchaea archaeon]